MKENNKPFEGCLFWNVKGFKIEDGTKIPTIASLYLKINKIFNADLGMECSKENIDRAKNEILSELAKHIELAFNEYMITINQR